MKYLIAILIITFASHAQSQEFMPYQKNMNPADSLLLINLPELNLPEAYKGKNAKDLPDTLNNSVLPFFRPVFTQNGWSCGQASTIGYQFTYEINRVNNTSAMLEENQYSPDFSFNYYNNGADGDGVNYFHSLDVATRFGNPCILDYGGMDYNLQKWVSGYDTYYNSMFNRVDEILAINVGDEEGLITLKYWMLDHLDGSEHGGIACFYTDLSTTTYLPEGTPEEGKTVITEFGSYSGHSMSFVGWNDSIRWDYNNDGQYTNDIDINEDGEINMKDWEIGGVILANSWGDDWGDNGFCYVMYNVLAQEKIDGGIWNKQVHVLNVKHDYSPSLTFKIKLAHTSRNKLKVIAGVSPNTSDALPQYTMDFPIYNYQGGSLYMQGDNTIEDHKTIEFGLDITPLLSYIASGETAKFFLQIHEHDPLNTDVGIIKNFSLMDYTDGISEIECLVTDTALTNNDYSTLSVIHTPEFDKVQINSNELPPYSVGELYSHQFSASGGTEPYSWDIDPSYTEIQEEDIYPNIQGEHLTPNNNNYGFATKSLDFPFPFYGTNYDTVYIHVNGYLMFDETPVPLPYQSDDLFLFKNIKMISPFSSENLYVSGSADQGLWYEGDETYAAFRWIAWLSTDIWDFSVNVSVILFPDGNIEFYFDETELLFDQYKVIGISNGNDQSYELSSISNVFAKTNINKITYLPENLSHEYSIEEDGYFLFDPAAENTINNINIRVTDYNEISHTKLFRISDGLLFDYQLTAGEDEIIEYGDTVKISLEIKNISTNLIENVQAEASFISDFITIFANQVSVGNLNAGEIIVLPDAIKFAVHSDVPDQHSIICGLDFNSNSGTWSGSFEMRANAPKLQMSGPVIVDNDNNRLDPGETAELFLLVNNNGHAKAYEVLGEILTNDPYITIEVSNELTFDDINPGAVSIQSVTITADENTPPGHLANFEVIYSAWPDMLFDYNFTLLIGRYPVFIIDLDPNNFSGPVMKSVIEDLNINVGYDIIFPENLDAYHNIFVSLGRKWSTYILSEFEGQRLADFLNDGGNIYMEGGETWSEDPWTPVHPMFNFNLQSTSYHACPLIKGIEGSFTEGVEFEYDSPFILFNHYLLPYGETFSILENSDNQYCYAAAYENETYKTIGTNFDFGGLIDNTDPSTKRVLMGRILQFFGLDVTITSTTETQADIESIQFQVNPNPVLHVINFAFTFPKSQDATLQIFDIHGNLIKTLFIQKGFTTGDHQITLQNINFEPGLYFARLTTEDYSQSIKVVVSK